jgi:hypothetical protein
VQVESRSIRIPFTFGILKHSGVCRSETFSDEQSTTYEECNPRK